MSVGEEGGGNVGEEGGGSVGDDTRRWVRAAPGQVSTELDGETVILDAEAGTYFGVEAVGAWIWDRIQDPVRIDRLLERLVDAYDVEPERGRRDLESFLEDLEDRGLAEVTDAPPG